METPSILLMTEGTFPCHTGGVSVWCDQLIRGMPGYQFHVVALVATAAEPAVWTLPGNVVSLVKMPLWGPAPVAASGQRGGRLRAGLPPRLLRLLIEILLDPHVGARQRFGVVLRELHEYCAQHGTLGASLASDKAVRHCRGPITPSKRTTATLAGGWRKRSIGSSLRRSRGPILCQDGD